MLTRYKRRSRQKKFHYSSLQKDTPITYPNYEPASPQAEAFHKSTRKIRCIFGGDRAAKTGTVAYEMIENGMRKFPGETFWSVALTGDLIAAIWEWHKIWLAPEERPEKNISWLDKGRGIPREFRHPNGSVMEYKTAASRAGVFAAKKVKGIHLDEDPARATTQGELIYNDCVSRTTQGGFICVAATPILGKNWMFKRLEKKQGDLIQCWHVSLRENKFISEEEKDTALALMSEDEIERRFYGRFTTLSGAAFKEFNASVHNLTEEPEIKASWSRIRVIDFGYNHPFYCLWIAKDDDGELWLYDEHHKNETLLEDHARIIYEKTLQHDAEFTDMANYRPIIANIADHDAQDRAELEKATLNAMRIFTSPALKSVDIGIQAVNRYFKVDPRGHTRIHISPRCKIAQEQCETYHYKQVSTGLEVKEVIDKIDDEAPDCLRYGVMYFEQGGRNYTVQ